MIYQLVMSIIAVLDGSQCSNIFSLCSMCSGTRQARKIVSTVEAARRQRHIVRTASAARLARACPRGRSHLRRKALGGPQGPPSIFSVTSRFMIGGIGYH